MLIGLRLKLRSHSQMRWSPEALLTAWLKECSSTSSQGMLLALIMHRLRLIPTQAENQRSWATSPTDRCGALRFLDALISAVHPGRWSAPTSKYYQEFVCGMMGMMHQSVVHLMPSVCRSLTNILLLHDWRMGSWYLSGAFSTCQMLILSVLRFSAHLLSERSLCPTYKEVSAHLLSAPLAFFKVDTVLPLLASHVLTLLFVLSTQRCNT